MKVQEIRDSIAKLEQEAKEAQEAELRLTQESHKLTNEQNEIKTEIMSLLKKAGDPSQ